MALTKAQVREILSAAGVSTENMETAVSKIIDGHVTSINALREDINTLKENVAAYKADAEKLPAVQKELDELKGGEDWHQKYEKEHSDFKAYKDQIAAKTAEEQKTNLYIEQVLKPAGVDDKRIKSIMRLTDLSKVVVKDGKIDGVDDLISGAKSEWSDFIPVESTKHTDPSTPPGNPGGSDKPSRAAQIAADYHKKLYGESKGE